MVRHSSSDTLLVNSTVSRAAARIEDSQPLSGRDEGCCKSRLLRERPPVAGKTCETGFERFSEQLCCEGNLFSFNPALKAEGKNPIKQLTLFLDN